MVMMRLHVWAGWLLLVAILPGGCVGASREEAARARCDAALSAGGTWDDPPKGLGFLRTVPELRGITSEMREAEFVELMQGREAAVERHDISDSHYYYVHTPRGENVVVMFDSDGTPLGIQRLMRGPQ